MISLAIVNDKLSFGEIKLIHSFSENNVLSSFFDFIFSWSQMWRCSINQSYSFQKVSTPYSNLRGSKILKNQNKYNNKTFKQHINQIQMLNQNICHFLSENQAQLQNSYSQPELQSQRQELFVLFKSNTDNNKLFILGRSLHIFVLFNDFLNRRSDQILQKAFLKIIKASKNSSYFQICLLVSIENKRIENLEQLLETKYQQKNQRSNQKNINTDCEKFQKQQNSKITNLSSVAMMMFIIGILKISNLELQIRLQSNLIVLISLLRLFNFNTSSVQNY
ncbi:unnamed protein product (macronuclear) [Paramecium tetraurelia]|uniref:Transmembrane protein n=1 Tax=Paramecium tetraurelia TaxID=5888 RepID=A0CZ85_PARTE|nr:uncharacterized protein GSPATT00011675001 [Paramecium tetraurelia]CAK76102.1 unnamed protein product [Paramecium tetraurelia]|eukprot:XP_001443499.1 hypothetical protein (macronuclear) [Paramecium tetraurelia strain d4-2]